MKNNKFLRAIEHKRTIVSDGATGTSLFSRGLPKGVAPEVWVLENPTSIVQLHKDFIAAGAEIILTCTFGGSSIRLNQSNLSSKSQEINRKAVNLAKVAVKGTTVLVAGSMGPLGQMLKPLGSLDLSKAEIIYSKQAKVLSETGVDLLVIETQYDLIEAKAAIRGARLVSSLPIVCSFSFDRGTRTMMGVSPKIMAHELSSFNLSAIGINCGRSLKDNLQALIELSQSTNLPIWFKPNAGLPEIDKSGNPKYTITPKMMGAQVKDWIISGAKIVGGCCGTSPEYLREIAYNVKNI